jgi:hypothetical protein
MQPETTPLELSIATWISGGIIGMIAGAATKKDHRILGALGGGVLGALLVGGIGDVLIERRYTPKWEARQLGQ